MGLCDCALLSHGVTPAQRAGNSAQQFGIGILAFEELWVTGKPQGLTPTEMCHHVPIQHRTQGAFPASLQNKHQRLPVLSQGQARLTEAQFPKGISHVNPCPATLSREETRHSKPRDLLGGVIPPARVGKDLQKLMGRCFWLRKKGEDTQRKVRMKQLSQLGNKDQLCCFSKIQCPMKICRNHNCEYHEG